MMSFGILGYKRYIITFFLQFLKIKTFEFYSYHEMGVYDLPAEISFVTRAKRDQIIFVGHSMGNTMFYVMAIEKPEVAEKVIAALCLSPVAFVNDMKSPIKLFAPFSQEFEVCLKRINK